MYPPTTSESLVGDSSSGSPVRPSHKRCRSPAATVPLPILTPGALVPTRVDLLPPRKRFRDSYSSEDSIKEDINADVLADIEADAASSKAATDIDVEAEVDPGIAIDVRDYIKVEDEDGMLMPVAVERLEQVVQGIYGHVMQIPLQRLEDIETGQRQLKAESLIASGERAGLLDHAASLERSNARLRDTLRMESVRADRLWRRMSFMDDELRQICRFRYYDNLRFRRLEAFAARRLGFRP
ncbi:hypothetical protein Tco_1440716 [Tanacetum coccineum]